MANQSIPKQLYRCEQVRELDSQAIHVAKIPGIQLMKRAGRAAFNHILASWPSLENLVVVCGKGNNAGDGYIVAALAAQRNIPVSVYSLVDPSVLTGDAERAYQYACQEKVTVELFSPNTDLVSPEGSVVVDAILGTGLKGELNELYCSAIEKVNSAQCPVIALDIPSGLCGDTGKVSSRAVKATSTITFIGTKVGLLTARGPAHTGQLIYDDLQVPSSVFESQVPCVFRTTSSDHLHALPAKEADAHKGQFGHVMVIGGDLGMGGAALMAAEACARAGAGLTSVATQPDHVAGFLARIPEVMVCGVPSGQALQPLLERPNVFVLGPGLGRTAWSEQMLQQAALKNLPLVVDADGLNLIAEGRVLPKAHRDNWILTPHPGEAARLLDCSVEEVQSDRIAASKALQKRYGGVIVLKGAGTLVCAKNQQGEQELRLANVGNAGMAVAGMGDVLSGVIGALVAQGLSLFEAACLAVCVHGDAGDLAVEESGIRGVFATDLIPYIRELLRD